MGNSGELMVKYKHARHMERGAGGRFTGLSERALLTKARQALKVEVKIEENFDKLETEIKEKGIWSLKGVAYALMQAMRAMIVTAKGPSQRGKPPHTRGKVPSLKRAITYNVNKEKGVAVIGPSGAKVATIGEVHDVGGKYKGGEYPARPFRAPAYAKVKPHIPRKFKDIL